MCVPLFPTPTRSLSQSFLFSKNNIFLVTSPIASCYVVYHFDKLLFELQFICWVLFSNVIHEMWIYEVPYIETTSQKNETYTGISILEHSNSEQHFLDFFPYIYIQATGSYIYIIWLNRVCVRIYLCLHGFPPDGWFCSAWLPATAAAAISFSGCCRPTFYITLFKSRYITRLA